MTIRNVPDSPPSPNSYGIRSGKPVKSNDQWLDMASAANYLNSHEMSLVTAHSVSEPVASTYAATYYLRPRQQVRSLLWIFVFRSRSTWYQDANNPYSYRATIQIAGGTTYSINVSGEEVKQYSIVDDVSQTTTPYQRTVVFTKVSGDSDMYIDQIACYQLRRYGLNPEAATTEYAADIASCESGSLIRDKDEYSIDGVVDAITTAKDNCRRAAMFSWYAPYTTGVKVGQGTAWQNLFHESPEVLARYVEDGATVTSITVDILCEPGNFTVGDSPAYLRVVASSGDVATATIAYGASPAYHSLSLDIKTETLTQSKGRTTADRLSFQVHGNGKTVGSETYMLVLYSIQAGET